MKKKPTRPKGWKPRKFYYQPEIPFPEPDAETVKAERIKKGGKILDKIVKRFLVNVFSHLLALLIWEDYTGNQEMFREVFSRDTT